MISLNDSDAHNSSESSTYPYQWLLFISLFVYGVYLRSGDLATKDLWLDELWRALVIRDSSSYFSIPSGKFIVLAEYLLGRLGIFIFGPSDIAFRIWPFIFSCGSIYIFILLCSQILCLSVAIATVFLFVVSPGLVEHSHEIKPYSLEVFLFLLSIYLIYLMDRKKIKSRLVNVTVTLICLTVYTLTPFIIAAYLYVLFSQKQKFKNSKKILTENLLYGVVIFIGCMFTYLSFFVDVERGGTVSFWSDQMISDWAHIKKVFLPSISWVVDMYVVPTNSLVIQYWQKILIFFASLLSPLLILKKTRSIFVMTWMPFLVMIILSTIGKYPFFTRVSAFYYPLVIFNSGILLSSILQSMPYYRKRKKLDFVIGILFSIVLVFVMSKSPRSANAGTNKHFHEVRKLISHVNENASTRDLVYIGGSIGYAIDYYGMSKKNDFEIKNFDTPKPGQGNVQRFLPQIRNEIERHKGRQAWFITAHRSHDYASYMEVFKRLGVEVIESKIVNGGYLIRVQY